MAEETLEQMKARQAARRKATMAKMGAVVGANEKQINAKNAPPKPPSKAVQAAKQKIKGSSPKKDMFQRTKTVDDASGFGSKKK